MKLKNDKAIARMRVAGRMVAECFQLIGETIKPGTNLYELDKTVEKYIVDQGAEPLYKGYQGSQSSHPPFPGVICASVNNEICHGLPNNRIVQEGDIVAIDIGLRYKGFCGDSCYTFAVGQISPRMQHLLDVTQECLRRGIEAAQPGNFLNDIGRAIHDYADTQGVSVVREWGGHGIGRALHESPSVSHIRQPQSGPRLRPGMTFTIEPMINDGGPEWVTLNDGWTVVTVDGKWSAQYEHTLAITANGPQILTTL